MPSSPNISDGRGDYALRINQMKRAPYAQRKVPPISRRIQLMSVVKRAENKIKPSQDSKASQPEKKTKSTPKRFIG